MTKRVLRLADTARNMTSHRPESQDLASPGCIMSTAPRFEGLSKGESIFLRKRLRELASPSLDTFLDQNVWDSQVLLGPCWLQLEHTSLRFCLIWSEVARGIVAPV